ncbi:MAG: ChaN family lipoprotein [Acidobacteriota bacterium]
MRYQTSGYRFTRYLLTSIKRRIREVIGPEDDEIQDYYAHYKRELKTARATPIERQEFVSQAGRRWVTLVGDFHTLEHAQKSYVHLLEDLSLRKTRPILALEMAHAHQDVPLLRFTRGALEETDFLESIRYFENWGFNFHHYRPIFEHARKHRLAIHGLNKDGSLSERDRFMAYRIRHLCARYPDQPLLVLVGDLHLASPHLPRALAALGIAPLVLLQNSESIYMRRLKRNQEPTGWFSLGRDRFLFNNTPPTVKMQTYLTWLEHGGEALLALYGFCSAGVDPDGEVELADTVQRYIRALHDLFGLRNKPDDDYQVFTFKSLEFLNDSYFRRPPGLYFARLVREGYSIYTPKGQTIYVPMMDLNRTVEEAMHYLMRCELATGQSLRDFLDRVHYFACGFLASRLINPNRHTPSWDEMRDRLAKIRAAASGKQKKKLAGQEAAYESALRFWEIRKRSGRWSREEIEPILKSDLETVFAVSRQVGYSVGAALYEAYDRGDLSGANLRRYAFQQRDPFFLTDRDA